MQRGGTATHAGNPYAAPHPELLLPSPSFRELPAFEQFAHAVATVLLLLTLLILGLVCYHSVTSLTEPTPVEQPGPAPIFIDV